MSLAGSAEPATPTLEISPWGRRFGAWAIDFAIFAAIFGAFGAYKALTELDAQGLLTENPDQAAIERAINDLTGYFFIFGLVATLVTTAYFIVMHAAAGKTFGKMICGIKVVKQDGSPCDWAAAGRRAVVYPLAGGVPYVGTLIALLNGFWPLWDGKHQSLGDKLAGTYVVKK